MTIILVPSFKGFLSGLCYVYTCSGLALNSPLLVFTIIIKGPVSRASHRDSATQFAKCWIDHYEGHREILQL